MLRDEISNSIYKSEDYSDEYLLKLISSMKERVSFVNEYLTKGFYFFEAPNEYEEKNLKKRWKEDSHTLLKKLRDQFDELNNPTTQDFESSLAQTAEELNISKGKLIHPLRIAVSGVGEGPGVFDILNILGKEEVINRINTALNKLK
jgi:glutamyl-tRNA synthetase